MRRKESIFALLAAVIFSATHPGQAEELPFDQQASVCMVYAEPVLNSAAHPTPKRVDGFESARQFLSPVQPVSGTCRANFFHFAYGSPDKEGAVVSPLTNTWIKEGDSVAASWWPLRRGLLATQNGQRFDLHNTFPVLKGDRDSSLLTDYRSGDGATNAANCSACSVRELSKEWRGDMARSILYMSIMYGPSQQKRGPLVLSDAPMDHAGGNRFGPMCQLLAWAIADPVSELELHRHRVASRIQGNTNPFVLNPDLVGDLWKLRCSKWTGAAADAKQTVGRNIQ